MEAVVASLISRVDFDHIFIEIFGCIDQVIMVCSMVTNLGACIVFSILSVETLTV